MASGFASVTNIMVNNFSFETASAPFNEDCTGPGCVFNRGPIPDWTAVGANGQNQPGTQFHNHALFNSVPDGITFGYSNGGTLSQTVGPTVEEGEIYTLMVDIGHRHDAPFMGSADLLVGSTAVPAIGDVPSPGNWSTYTARFVGTTANEGQTITIQLNASGIQGAFDDVRLTSEPVPEPSSMLLLGAGLLPVIGVIRRRYLNR